MFIDIDTATPRGSVAAVLSGLSRSGLHTKSLGKGLFEIGHFNFDMHLRGGVTWESDATDAAWLSSPDFGEIDGEWMGSYGVCDSAEQFLAHPLGQWLNSSDRRFVVGFTCVRKADQPDDGGWRWHKWGEYIGTATPQYEYLHDEDDIEHVFCYHVYERIAGD